VIEDHKAPTVNEGDVDARTRLEGRGREPHGFAHPFEHLMFQGVGALAERA